MPSASDPRVGRVRKARNLRVLAVIALLSVIAGCSEKGSVTAAAKVLSVEVGMTQNEVLAIMGPPQRRETRGGTEFLIYPSGGASEAAALNFVPIAIVDGRVTGIGRNLYDAVVRAKAQTDQVSH
jgi:hypothetical protein